MESDAEKTPDSVKMPNGEHQPASKEDVDLAKDEVEEIDQDPES